MQARTEERQANAQQRCLKAEGKTCKRKQDEPIQQQVVIEDARVKEMPRWSDTFGSSNSPASNGDSKSPEAETATADHQSTTRQHEASSGQSTATSFDN